MKPETSLFRRKVLLFLLICCPVSLSFGADLLFIGNSFTYGGEEAAVVKFGGVPKLVEAIASSRQKTASTLMVTTGGKDWGFHLANPATDSALKVRSWDGVVLQDYSTQPTHAGDTGAFMRNGQLFYDRIAKESPLAEIVLYETWAYAATHKIFAVSPTAHQFTDPAQMTAELAKNYAALRQVLQARDPHRIVALARVGEAFARSLQENPGINLYAGDFKHPSRQGCYLAALVIYSTFFHDSPVGATRTLPGFTLEADEAAKLQAVAQQIYLQGN
jgi:hypothetical protein